MNHKRHKRKQKAFVHLLCLLWFETTTIMRILCTHLFNDYSGSPLVLSTAIKAMKENDHAVTLMTSKSEGFLSNLETAEHLVDYNFYENKVMRLMQLFYNQLIMMFFVLKNSKNFDVVYINTLLPFGAALGGWMTGKKVVYHIHETSIRPEVFKKFLLWVAKITASEAIYVSKFLLKKEPLKGVPSKVVYNSLNPTFVEKANDFLSTNPEKEYPFTTLMLCSLKEYKGVFEFVELAQRMPKYKFELVINSTMEQINEFFATVKLPENLVIFPAQKDVHWFYERAHLVVNLSHVNRWVETFGMTILEAMHYGIPTIVPPAGGPVELVESGKNGYLISSEYLNEIQMAIQQMAKQTHVYDSFVRGALVKSKVFSSHKFNDGILNIFKPVKEQAEVAFS